MKARIPDTKPSITELELRVTIAAAVNGWDAHNGWGDHCAGDMRSPV